MQRTLISQLSNHKGQEVIVKSWVHNYRDKKMVFWDLRDRSGMVQAIVFTNHPQIELAKSVRMEWVLELRCRVNERPEGSRREGVINGDIELEVLDITVLNEAQTPPFELANNTIDIDEELRLKYRYLDLRTERMQSNIRMRDKIITFFRKYMHENDFVEIETPMLMKDTPEGSREYIVPSRINPGKFYALPQSPQQFKQLLMVAGFERYFQIARCMRDEDLRGDRQPEFTQLDFEMSFVEQEDILSYTEPMFIKMVQELYPNKRIQEIPFPRLTYQECMEKYGSDKPDLREDKNDPDLLAFAWVVDFPMFETLEDGSIQAAHHPFCSVKPEDREKFMKGEDLMSIRANSYDLVLNGYELSSGSIRIHERTMQEQVFNLLNISPEEQESKFGHILRAFTYGAPPHGGFAPGIDRIVMIMQNEPNIREVIAFPKNRNAEDLMMNAPAVVAEKQLTELSLKVLG